MDLRWLVLCAALLLSAGSASGATYSIFDGQDGPRLFESYNAVSGTSYASSAELSLQLGPDASGIFDGRSWSGGVNSVVVAISTSATRQNVFGLYSDLSGGASSRRLLPGYQGNRMLGPVFDAEFLFADAEAVEAVGFFLRSFYFGVSTWHSDPALDEASGRNRLTVLHFDAPISIATDEGDLLLYQPHLLGWEDMWDGDYNDLVVLVGDLDETIVPEPGTALLLAGGVAGLAWRRRRARRTHRA